VASFIGSPTMNFIPGQLQGTGDASRFVFAGATLELPGPVQGEVSLGQRPEHIHLSDDAPWRGEVSLVEPTGADTQIFCKMAGNELTIVVRERHEFKPGTKIRLTPQLSFLFDPATGARIQ
jgi:multiple sugar transport system ATP-binding protein